MELYGYICDKHYTTVITWVGWKAEDDGSLPCCAECGATEKMRHVTTAKIDSKQVKKHR